MHPDSAVAEIRNPSLLVSRGPRRVTKVVLFPVRFLFTADTGRVGTNHLAAEHYLASGHARRRTGYRGSGWRREPPADAEAAVALVGRDLIPLYVQYIDDHVARLRIAGHHRLAGKFSRWRGRLTSLSWGFPTPSAPIGDGQRL